MAPTVYSSEIIVRRDLQEDVRKRRFLIPEQSQECADVRWTKGLDFGDIPSLQGCVKLLAMSEVKLSSQVNNMHYEKADSFLKVIIAPELMLMPMVFHGFGTPPSASSFLYEGGCEQRAELSSIARLWVQYH
jgi:hypothetical protein